MAFSPYCRHGSRPLECSVCGKDHKIELLEQEVEQLQAENERLKAWKETAIKDHPELGYSWTNATGGIFG